MALLCRVAVHFDRIEINISRRRLAELLSGQSIDLTTRDQRLDRKSDDLATLTVPARLKRVGREMRMLVENADRQTAAESELAEDYRSRARYPETPQSKYQFDRARHRARGASDGRLPLYTPPATLAGTRHHHSNCQWPATASIQRHDVDAEGVAAAGRLGRAASPSRISLKIASAAATLPCRPH